MAAASPDPPLRVDWIEADAFTDERPGRLGLTFLPGKRGPSLRYPGRIYRRDLAADLATLSGLGVRRLLLLVEDGELERWGDPDIVERAARAGIEVARRPIPDGAAPASHDEVDGIVEWVRRAREDGDVAIGCMGGVGRSGTVAACALVAAGWAPDEAITQVRQVRHPSAVETAAQVEFVRSYAARR